MNSTGMKPANMDTIASTSATRRANERDHLVGKTGRLWRDRVPQFGTRGDVAESAFACCEDSVREGLVVSPG